MTEQEDPLNVLKQLYPELVEEISHCASSPVFQDLCEDMVFLNEQISELQDSSKRDRLIELQVDLEEELHAFLSKKKLP